jgi:hypothetical protein
MRGTEDIVRQLEPPGEDHGVPEWFNERAPGFSADQRSAIAAYLDWYRERDEERWAGGEPPRHVHRALAYWWAPDETARRSFARHRALSARSNEARESTVRTGHVDAEQDVGDKKHRNEHSPD